MDTAVIPDHVSPELVFEFDYIAATTGVENPYALLMELDERGAPDIFFSPLLGGHWVTRRYDDIFEIFRDHDHFATYPIAIPPLQIQGQPTRLPPLQTDPPEHGKYRRVLGPLFTPAATKRVDTIVRQTAIELIDTLVAQGEADFVKRYAAKFPPLVFLRLMDMPLERVDEFVSLASAFLGGTPEQQSAAGPRIMAFVTQFVDQKYANPGQDWASVLILAKDTDGTPTMSREEVLNTTFFLFLAGLDTVVNSMSYAWRYLANNPEVQQKLGADHSLIPNTVEELFRMNTIINNSRSVRQDMQFRGLTLKKGDAVLMLTAVANREEGQFSSAGEMDATRETNLHLTFGAGIHRCLGSNIARAEMRISIEEWLKRIPHFQIKAGAQIRSTGGVTMGLESLPLVWGSEISISAET